MKLLYTVILLVGIIQLFAIEPLEGASAIGKVSPKYELVKFYNKEFNLVSRDTCVKFKKISEDILKDGNVKKAATPLMQQFKRNITHFLQIYPDYAHYGLYENLLVTFSDMIIYHYYQDRQESLYIVEKISKLGFDRICDEYEGKVLKFFSNKFLPRLEKYRKTTSSKESQKLSQWLDLMKECKDYTCALNHFNKLEPIILTPKEQLFIYIRQQVQDLYIKYGKNATAIAKGVLKNSKVKRLKSDTSHQLTQNIKEYIKKYDSNHDINQLYNVILIFQTNVVLTFYNNYNIPTKERQLLVEIFNAQGLTQFISNYKKHFNDFVENGLLRRLERFKKSLNKKESRKEKVLLDWIEHFKKLKTYEDRIEAFTRLDYINF